MLPDLQAPGPVPTLRPCRTCAMSKIAASTASRAAPATYSDGGLPSHHSTPSRPACSLKRSSADTQLEARDRIGGS